jgi:hypothetical protein
MPYVFGMSDPNAPIHKLEHLVEEARTAQAHLLSKTRDYAEGIAQALGIMHELKWGRLAPPPGFMPVGDDAYLSGDGWLTRALQVPIADLTVSSLFSVKLHGHAQGHLTRIAGVEGEYDMLAEAARKRFYVDAVQHIEHLLRNALGYPAQ